jgi:hypothetical protein
MAHFAGFAPVTIVIKIFHDFKTSIATVLLTDINIGSTFVTM